MRDVLMLCFALLMRCPIVDSGTRNDFAISAVVSPPTARNVSAIAAGPSRLPRMVSEVCHYMHRNFARIHETLRVTPAIQAGLSDPLWSVEEIVVLNQQKSHARYGCRARLL